jgi:hypothetical protein
MNQTKNKYTMSINNAHAIYLLLHGNSATWATLSHKARAFAKNYNHLFDVTPLTFWEWRIDQGITFTEERRGLKYDEKGPAK